MNTIDPEKISEQIREHSAVSLEQATKQIEDLAASVDAVSLFVAVVANMAFAPEGSASEMTHGDIPAKVEALAYHLYPFFGVPDNGDITPWHVNECIEPLDTLFQMRLINSVFADGTKGESRQVDSIAILSRIQAEVVRGSAFPEQTGEEISAIQGHFDSWFARAVGLSPTKAKDR